MSWESFVQEAISILVAGISGTATGIGDGLSTLVTSIAISGTGSDATMSPFFAVVLVFGSISLALALCRWVVNLVSSLGNRNR